MVAKNAVSDKEFNNAREAHLERIQNTCRAFSGALSPDALTACGDIALWRALQNFDESFGQSFTSSLHRFIKWECLRALQDKTKGREVHMNGGDVEAMDDSVSQKMILDDYLSILSNRDRRMVEARFLENCTFQEIAHREGYSKQGIKNIVERSVALMAELAQTEA